MKIDRNTIMRSVVDAISSRLPDGLRCTAGEASLQIMRTAPEEGQLVEVPLAPLYARAEKSPEAAASLVVAFAERVLAIVRGQLAERSLQGAQERVYPVLRHASFVKRDPDRWVFQPHTEETSILYAIDDQEGYHLIEKGLLAQAGWTGEELHQHAMRNLQRLPVPQKRQQVGPNQITFIAPGDGYAASRILLAPLLEEMRRTAQGDALGIAIPHGDVLIIADLHGKAGADLLARLTYDFASKSSRPLSFLPFFYEGGELVPFLTVSHDRKPGRAPADS